MEGVFSREILVTYYLKLKLHKMQKQELHIMTDWNCIVGNLCQIGVWKTKLSGKDQQNLWKINRLMNRTNLDYKFVPRKSQRQKMQHIFPSTDNGEHYKNNCNIYVNKSENKGTS